MYNEQQTKIKTVGAGGAAEEEQDGGRSSRGAVKDEG
jgi:hypothetical protein